MPRSSLNTANSEAAARLAEQTAAAMFSRDAASRLIGITIVSIRPGYSLLTMKVRPDMVNGHHICHGGYLFTLADSAFAYACNAYNRNTVASACHIDFLTPAREGELLEAECEERSRSGRTGVYDTTIRDHHGKVIALSAASRIASPARSLPGLKQTRAAPWRPRDQRAGRRQPAVNRAIRSAPQRPGPHHMPRGIHRDLPFIIAGEHWTYGM
jgi:acyl-CoA thioesterase